MSDLATIAEAADALTNPIRVREPIHRWEGSNRKTVHHTHTMPSLLDQLHAAVVPGEVYVEDDAGHIHRTPRSIPPARLEAINACLTIDAAAAMWAKRLKLAVRETAADNIRALIGAQTDSDTEKELLVELRRWYSSAAVLTGWERPPWRPDVPCPLCGQKGLRVRLDRSTASCVQCGEGWTEQTIGLLAEHVRVTTAGA